MDSVPRPAHTHPPATSVAPTREQPTNNEPSGEGPAERGEDPYSPGPLAFSGLLGSVIALATMLLPLGAVLASRPQVPPPQPSPAATPAVVGEAP